MYFLDMAKQFSQDQSSTSSNTRLLLSKGEVTLWPPLRHSQNPTRVKSDALFSYQLPFNILAFLLLSPLSWCVSPRTLHGVNVFLIKVTVRSLRALCKPGDLKNPQRSQSFPILIVIGIYERHFAPGRRFVEQSKNKIAEIYHALPRQLRSVPLLEALMGNNGRNLMEAIFLVDLPPDEVGNLFPEEFKTPDLSRGTSRMSVAGMDGNLEVSQVPQSPTSVTTRRTGYATKGQSQAPSRRGLSRPPPVNTSSAANFAAAALAPPADQDAPIHHDIYDSPLVRLMSGRSAAYRPSDANVNWEEAVASLKKVESLLEAVKETPVVKLRDDIKELQVRLFVDFRVCHGAERSTTLGTSNKD